MNYARTVKASMIALTCTMMLTACSDERPQPGTIRQTGFPGQVTAGGTSSGELMSRIDNTVAQMPAGTPGIPEGSGGSTGGAAMGATVQSQAAAGNGGSNPPPTPSQAAPASPVREGRGITAHDPSVATSKAGIGVVGAPEKGQLNIPEGPK